MTLLSHNCTIASIEGVDEVHDVRLYDSIRLIQSSHDSDLFFEDLRISFVFL